jgi:hypothetical protein
MIKVGVGLVSPEAFSLACSSCFLSVSLHSLSFCICTSHVSFYITKDSDPIL